MWSKNPTPVDASTVAAVEAELERDLRLARLAFDSCRSRHRLGLRSFRSAGARCRRFAVDWKSLGPRQRGDVRRQLSSRGARNGDDRRPPHESARAERAAEARRAAGRQDVIGARGVVAESGRRRRGRRTRSPRRAPRAASSAPSKASSRCSGANASARLERELDARAPRPGASGASATLGRSAASASTSSPTRSSRAGVGRDRDQRAVVAVLGLGAEVERDQARGRRSPSATTTSSLGPAIPSIPTRAGDLALGLGDEAVAGAGDRRPPRRCVSVP